MDTGRLAAQLISIHALRKESDACHQPGQPGHPISIHALRKESDHTGAGPRKATTNFNPRSP